MKIIIWLWNPGTKYQNTRHNAWFLCVDFLQKQWQFSDFSDSKFLGALAEWSIHHEKIILFKPTTFMNLSWNAVSLICNFYKVNTSDILVISDDIDMDFGKIRYKEKWSHGWQNGLKDIITKLWTTEFARLKIGIGRHEKMAVADWVLSKFSKEESKILEQWIFPECEKRILELL